MIQRKIFEKRKKSMIEVDLGNISEASFMSSKVVSVCLGSMGTADLEEEKKKLVKFDFKG